MAAQLDMAEPELEMLQAGEEEGSAALLEAEEAQRDWQERWDQFAQRASEPTRRADVAQSRIQATEQQIIRLDQGSASAAASGVLLPAFCAAAQILHGLTAVVSASVPVIPDSFRPAVRFR